jgi:hypothetical protein
LLVTLITTLAQTCNNGRKETTILWLWVSRGVALNLFGYVMYIAPIGSKHESESLVQNLTIDIAKV